MGENIKEDGGQRMADGGRRRSEFRGQKTEVRRQRSEVRGQKSEVRSQKSAQPMAATARFDHRMKLTRLAGPGWTDRPFTWSNSHAYERAKHRAMWIQCSLDYTDSMAYNPQEKAGKDKLVRIHINDKYCKRCGYCIAFCPKGVFQAARDGLPIAAKPEECTQCRQCDLRCPDMAIRLEGVDNG